MLFTSGNSPHLSITSKVYDFFTEHYEIDSDVEVYHTDLSDENALGFTEVNGKEQFIQIHNDLNEEDHITTVLHELIHVKQNEQGITSDKVREDQAYHMEKILYDQYLRVSEKNV
jgi:predicted metallopeptidase